MTDPGTVAVASVAAGLAVAIGWLFRPRAPTLDGERHLKAVMATLLRGRVEAAGGQRDAWVDAVLREVPYHPAGRQPERKITAPDAALPVPALDGERALVEKLASLATIAERWAWMLDGDEVGRAARLGDPADLGPAYDPSRVLGPTLGWEALAAWGAGAQDAVPSALSRQLPATWVLCDGRPIDAPDVLGALERLLPAAVRVPWSGLEPAALVALLEPRIADPAHRLVLVGADAGIQTVLRALAEHAPLRDATLAVLSVGGVLGGLPDEAGPLGEAAVVDWMAAWFGHHELDTEIARYTPYLALQWLDRAADPPGAFGLPVRNARFGVPRAEGVTMEGVLPVDLGVLPVHGDADLVARALWVSVTAWVRACTGS